VAEEAGPPIAADSEVVALDGVSISYAHRGKPDVEAVRDFSLRVNRGEVMSLVGPSGCGKTSLLRAIAGLRTLTSGRIEIRTAAGQAPFAVVFQQPSLLPWRTAIQNAAYGIECMTKDRKLTRSRAAGALAMVGLAGYENYYPNQLSGGMQQRVNLARALAVQPAVLLLDEPFSSLDAQLRERMQTEFLGVIEETNATALFVTHQVDEAVYLSDRVAVMSSEPGMLRSVLTVDLPKRRDARDRRGGDFMELCDAVAATLARPAGSEDLA
jgi:NitT/TauT family transport system ATP-binding protein